MSPRGDRGAIAVEFVLILPLLMAIAGMIIAGGRIFLARSAVQQVADSGARQASIARNAAEADHDARQLIQSDLAASDVACADGVRVAVDTAGFGVSVGAAATVGVTVSCTLNLGDLLIQGLSVPGTIEADATARSTLDRLRARR